MLYSCQYICSRVASGFHLDIFPGGGISMGAALTEWLSTNSVGQLQGGQLSFRGALNETLILLREGNNLY